MIALKHFLARSVNGGVRRRRRGEVEVVCIINDAWREWKGWVKIFGDG